MLIISNPKAGDQKGSQFLKEHVIPLLTRHAESTPIEFTETSAPGDAGVIASRYLKRITQGDIQEESIIVLSGGDTTIHEVVNGIIGLKQSASVIVVPSGTANALYHSLFPPKGRVSFLQALPSVIREEVGAMHEDVREKLYAVLTFLTRGATRQLYSTRTKILDTNGEATKEIMSCVVVSACKFVCLVRTFYSLNHVALHASILDGAEALRLTHPGIERFKIAAAQSITQWSTAKLIVRYPYQVYDRHQGVFRALESQVSETDSEEFKGPFAYFLTTTNVDRLEKEFRITPLSTSIPFTEDAGWMEVLMIRPQNNTPPRVDDSNEESRKKFAATTMGVLQAAYNDGGHLTQGGEEVNSVVEYLRVRSWEWIPVCLDINSMINSDCAQDQRDAAAHLICVDGEIMHIPQGGRAAVELLSGVDRPELSIYCGPL